MQRQAQRQTNGGNQLFEQVVSSTCVNRVRGLVCTHTLNIETHFETKTHTLNIETHFETKIHTLNIGTHFETKT